MPKPTAQQRAIKNYRARIRKQGLSRFEVLGRSTDKALLRALARALAERTPRAAGLRAAVRRAMTEAPAQKGGILTALRRSPLVDADLDLTRPRERGRPIEL